MGQVLDKQTKSQAKSYTLPDGNSLIVYKKVEHLPSTRWNELAKSNLWLQTSWLAVLAKAGGPKTSYLLFQAGSGEDIGIVLLQHLPVRDMQLGPNVRPSIVSVLFGEELHQFGQALFSGPQGFDFLPGYDAHALLAAARKALEPDLVSGPWLLKDSVSEQHPDGWIALDALPEMQLKLRPTWSTFEDYLADLPSKYRTRAKRARKKFTGLEQRVLNEQEALQYQPQIDELYQQLRREAQFVPFTAPPGYISKLAQSDRQQVQLRGYFDKERLVGFSTLLLGEDRTIAHYAAVDTSYNASHQLYLNLLYDLLCASIQAGVSTLNLGRTATTIKSSLGALPLPLHSYACHQGCLRHQLLNKLNDRVLQDHQEELIQRPLG